MTTPIRPGLPSLAPTPQRSAAFSDAQRAFFQAALQGAQTAAVAARPATPPAVQTTPVQTVAPAQASADQPAERLGRYLDIRV